jgi:REP element-mobilizing transposase RayT
MRHEIFIHVMFSTKGRRPTIPDDMKERLWTHMESMCKEHKIGVHAIGGTTNHVHLLLEPPPTLSLEEMVLKLQAESAEWINRQAENFVWQDGYGACSISKSKVGRVVKDIQNQEQYHATTTYEEEFLNFLKDNRIPYDPQDVFG